jgi:GNAT superfamily N-acetyltransferase
MSIDEYTVGLASREHIRMLPEIERAAAALFPDDVLTPETRASTVPIEQLEAAHAEGRLWAALTKTGTPVGFAIAIRESETAFLREVDVHPAHQQKGLGRQLIKSVLAWAQAHQFSFVTLTTFEYVPWNAPFYSRLGFRKLAEHELSCDLLGRLQSERRQGLRQRVAMQLTLGSEQTQQCHAGDVRNARA